MGKYGKKINIYMQNFDMFKYKKVNSTKKIIPKTFWSFYVIVIIKFR